MATATKREFITAAQVFEKLTEARAFLDTLQVHDSFTIEDYPIGGANRGNCRLSVESNKRGRRTIRQTTNKHGRWCNPKKSTYSEAFKWVVTGDRLEKRAGWLSISMSSVAIQAANGEWTILAEAPCLGKPRREDYHYEVSVSQGTFDENGYTAGPETKEQKVIYADPPELCDAWDAWDSGVKEIARWFKQKHEG